MIQLFMIKLQLSGVRMNSLLKMINQLCYIVNLERKTQSIGMESIVYKTF